MKLNYMKYVFFCFAVTELLKTLKMFCMKCVTKIQLDANFWNNCGKGKGMWIFLDVMYKTYWNTILT